MILKIRFKDDWWIFGEISKLRYSYRSVPLKSPDKMYIEYNKAIGDDTNLVLIEKVCWHPEGTECHAECPEPNTTLHYVEACFRQGQDEYTAVFDTIAYLCNDEGKTIEKIVP